MSKTLIRQLVLSAAGLMAAQAACAADIGFYVGGFYGMSEKEESIGDYQGYSRQVNNDFGYTPDSFTQTLDSRSKSYGFVGGYRLLENLAVEGGYMQLGVSKYRDRASGSFAGIPTDADPNPPDVPSDLVINIDSEIGGIALSALGILPVSYRGEVYGRAGLMFSTHEVRRYLNDDSGGPPLRDAASESSTDFLAGIGASFLVAEVYTLRAEYIRVFDAGNEDFGEGDVSMLTVGVTVRF